ncbi:hypothetical protein Q5P01_020131 [Channa striata]|uniref:G-protein coupled receptors family 1 profile domain-containing protein n=1 Tax=Channa striata TaxID=64152 RepID=A0AA88LX84_CHASR|nr:hypothetical protein Q5P01_020131 [Channa striata]
MRNIFMEHLDTLLLKDRPAEGGIYLSNLALADFILTCGLPFWVMYILSDLNWTYGLWTGLCKIVNFIIIIIFYTSSAPQKVQETISCVLNYSRDIYWKVAHQILINIAGFLLPVMVIVFSGGNIIKALAQRRESEGFHDTNDTKATLLVYAHSPSLTHCPFQALDEKLWVHHLNIGDQDSVYLAFLNSVLNHCCTSSQGSNLGGRLVPSTGALGIIIAQDPTRPQTNALLCLHTEMEQSQVRLWLF